MDKIKDSLKQLKSIMKSENENTDSGLLKIS